ncbi:2'-5' RNA ligase family protein [Flavobacterium sp.]|uniref:2'-5' RNA ligase family protein n=1 Tax=Flavobacterium sp. TaxID=239 RepID=UPI002D167D0D|nr:2'-5' RNA ligase family protein [Flavobacterium sp.]HSD05809.1 2'-5' RNA ligase family protein [Flavobacterium sp.]
MENLYSLVIHPPVEILALVKSMKEQLATEVGWFNSKNSVGHITICEFTATETNLESIKKHIIKLCDSLIPVDVHLNKFGSFPNGAFFIAPDTVSKKDLKHIMKRFNSTLQLQNMKKSDNPHLSIARRLNPENLLKVNQLFTKIDLHFVCDGVVLRKFDQNIKQFFVTDTFPFHSNPEPQSIQGTLF